MKKKSGIFSTKVKSFWVIECYDRKGRLKWTEYISNLVVTVGLNKILDACFKTGLAAPAWYIGLVDNAGFVAYAAGDTMGSHAGWSESTIYSEGNRQSFTPGAIAGGQVNNAASKGVFNINNTGTIRGALLCDDNTKGGSSGTLYGEGDFSVARAVENGDILNVQVTLQVSSA